MKALFLVLALGLLQGPARLRNFASSRVVGMSYPVLALAARIEGMVTLELTVGKDGKVADAKTVGFANRVLADAALLNIRQWRFRALNEPGAAAPTILLTYGFKFQGVSSGKLIEGFVFDDEGIVTVTSELPCPDHIPCPEDRLRR